MSTARRVADRDAVARLRSACRIASYAVTPGSVAPVGSGCSAFALDVLVALVAVGIGCVVAPPWPRRRDRVLLCSCRSFRARGGARAVDRRGAVGCDARERRDRHPDGLGLTGRPAGLLPILVRQLVVAAGALVLLVGQWVVVASGAWDRSPAQRGWHDKAAGTVVLRAEAVRRGSGRRDRAAWDRLSRGSSGRAARAGGARPVPESRSARHLGPVAPARPARRAAPPAAAPPAAARGCRSAAGLGGSRAVPAPVTRPVPAAPRWCSGPPGAALIDSPATPYRRSSDGRAGHVGTATAPERCRPAGSAAALRHRRGARRHGRRARRAHVRRRRPGPTTWSRSTTRERSISKVHLAFGPEADGARLWVMDRGSTNGTVLVGPDGARRALSPGRAPWSSRGGPCASAGEPRGPGPLTGTESGWPVACPPWVRAGGVVAARRPPSSDAGPQERTR